MHGDQRNPELDVQSGLPIHVFKFSHGAEQLQFATPGRTPEEAAEKLVHMLNDLLIQIRIKFPKVAPEQKSQEHLKNGGV